MAGEDRIRRSPGQAAQAEDESEEWLWLVKVVAAKFHFEAYQSAASSDGEKLSGAGSEFG